MSLRLSDFKLNKELHRASTAFLSGFRRLIDEKWLRMLSEDELQQAWLVAGCVLGVCFQNNDGKNSLHHLLDDISIIRIWLFLGYFDAKCWKLGKTAWKQTIEASLSQDRKDCHPIFGRAEKIVSWSFSLQDWKLVKDNLQIGHGQSNKYKVELQYSPRCTVYTSDLMHGTQRTLGFLGQPLCRTTYTLHLRWSWMMWCCNLRCKDSGPDRGGCNPILVWRYDMIYIYSVSLCLSLIFVSIIL